MDGLELSPLSPATKSHSPSPSADGGGEEEQDGGGLGPVEVGGEVVSPAKFSFSAPMDNLVVRSYQFSIM